MKMWKIFLLSAAALALATTGFAQPATYTFYYFDEGGGTNPPLGCPCTAGTAYPDGVDICLYWDQDNNGITPNDPQPAIGTGPGQVFQNCWTFNGEEGGIERGYFVIDPPVSFQNPLEPEDHPLYYFKISAGVGGSECCWYSYIFEVEAGAIADVYTTIDDWTCAAGLCPSDAVPPAAPTGVNASDDTECMSVRVTWQHDGVNVTSFKIYRDDNPEPVATTTATARETNVPETTTGPHTFYVKAFNTSIPSDPSNSDVGRTFLKRFVSGPNGDVTGQNLAGRTDTLFFERPTSQCNSGSKIYLIYNVDTNPTQWGILASCSLCTSIRFTLPNDPNLNYCQIALRCSSFQHSDVFTYDTTESVFHLGTPDTVDAVLRNLVLPDQFDLAQNFPNPFNPETQIVFNVPVASDVRIRVYNLMGQHVRTLTEARYSTGVHAVTWDGRNDSGQLVSAGVYLYRMETPGFAMTKKMLLMK